jgi:2,4-dienoyl-CoA reductase-like NADH-dependent reductase (Old Yellow Enzyme family)
MRVSATDWFEGGFTPDEAVRFVAAAKAEGLDYVCVSSGGMTPRGLPPMTNGSPTLRLEHPLAEHERVTLSAHSGFRTYEASATLLRRALDIVRRLVPQRSCQ